ncbi:uncharacterized protein DS421_17g583540 [Arachis hypogaea]|nr:uncharacterized protein DS421_17g583540 [Arachis hypogaea]
MWVYVMKSTQIKPKYIVKYGFINGIYALLHATSEKSYGFVKFITFIVFLSISFLVSKHSHFSYNTPFKTFFSNPFSFKTI